MAAEAAESSGVVSAAGEGKLGQDLNIEPGKAELEQPDKEEEKEAGKAELEQPDKKEERLDDARHQDMLKQIFQGARFAVAPGDSNERIDSLAKALSEFCIEDVSVLSDIADKIAKEQVQGKLANDEGGDDGGEEAFWAALKAGNFHFGTGGSKGNPAGGRWARALKADANLKAEYDQVQGRKDKEAFRAKWAASKYENYVAAKSFTQEYKEVDWSDVKYKSIAKIAQDEGGGKQGMIAACNVAIRCYALKGRWYRFDEWTRTVKFGHLESGWSETMAKVWTKKKTWSTAPEPTNKRKDTPEEEPKPTQTPNKKPKGAGGGAGGAAGGGAGGSAGDPPSGQKKKASKLPKLLGNAKKLKMDLSTALQQVKTLVTKLDTSPDWAPLNSPACRTSLDDAQQQVNNLVAPGGLGHDLLLCSDVAELKSSMPAAALEKALNVLIENLGVAVKSLSSECKVLLDQQKIRMASRNAK